MARSREGALAILGIEPQRQPPEVVWLCAGCRTPVGGRGGAGALPQLRAPPLREATGGSVTYGSVCSGIEAATVAWRSLGWRAAWFAEIDPFARAVLTHRYPEVLNLGDFTTIRGHWLRRIETEPIDLLVGGTPCQPYSIAGNRLGMADPAATLSGSFLDWLSASGRAGSSGKMSPVFSRLTLGGRLEPSSGRWRNSGTGCRTGFWTLSSSECPNAAVASSLSDILETGRLPQRYFLSAVACAGILRRAAKQGISVPPMLREVLTRLPAA